MCLLATGNGFGGGSTHNAMLYVRGSPLDYDEWMYQYGCNGWSYSDLIPVFESFENRKKHDGIQKFKIDVSQFDTYQELQTNF